MFRSAAVLGFGATFGLIGNVVCSIYLDPTKYGELTAILSTVSILAVLCSLGFPWYCLADQVFYALNKNKIYIITLAATAVLSSLIAVYLSGFVVLGAIGLLLATVAAGQAVLAAQIQRKQLRAAFMQSVPAFSKGCAALLIPFSFYAGLELGDRNNFYYASLFWVSALFFLGVSFFVFRGGFRPSQKKEESGDVGLKVGKLIAYLLSAVLSLSYNMALPPVVAYFHGGRLAAYLGIYQLFWSVNSLLLTAAINNKLTPSYLGAKCEVEKAGIYAVAKRYCLFIGSGSALITLVGGYVGYITIWGNYEFVVGALAVGALAVFVRSVSAAIGISLSSKETIKEKTFVQAVVFLVMLLSVSLFENASAIDLMWIVVMLEVILFCGYSLAAKFKVV